MKAGGARTYGPLRDSDTFSDIAATIADNFKIEYDTHGESLFKEIAEDEE